MSTFNGKIREILGISVDHFEDSQQKCYFLSHCHTDHMKGLCMLKTDAPVYTTSISSLIIRRSCPNLSSNVKILELGIPTMIELQPDETEEAIRFSVTALSAGHCVGSCMFLFQVEDRNILYTGDFRTSLKDAKNIKLLKEIRSHKNTTIYLDSTFLKTSFPQFPTQSESVTKVIDIAKHFLDKSNKHKVYLHVPARYGYEYLLIELSMALNVKIFVHEQEVYDQYTLISKLDSCVSRNRQASRIHLEPTFLNVPVDPTEDPAHRLDLQLSAMFWTNWDQEMSFVKRRGRNAFRVCYATHNSFNEIRDFLLYMKAGKVYLNVVPVGVEEKSEMLKQLALIQNQFSENSDEIKVEEAETVKKKFSFKRDRSAMNVNREELDAAEKKIKRH